uniref:Uncharacterized protein n=1 Tax=Anopheles culicifacies TaxID=139723 RepID=A0A182LSC6_9DIPT
MSATEDTTATAQLASDPHHQQNVVSPSATSTSSTSVPAAVAGAGTAATSSSPPTPTNAGSPTVTTLSAATTGSTDTGIGSGASTTLPANNGSNNSDSKEGVGGVTAAPVGNNRSVTAADVTDAANSCDSEKAPVVATASPPQTEEGISAAGIAGASDSLGAIEPGSSGGTSTPIAGASPASLGAGDVAGTNVFVGGGSVIPTVTNGDGAGNASVLPVAAGSAIPTRGRDVTDKHSTEYHCRVLEGPREIEKHDDCMFRMEAKDERYVLLIRFM